MSFHAPKKLMVRHPVLGMGEGNNGFFKVILPPQMKVFAVIASDQMGWEHVSVSLPDRTPTWNEMCRIKDLFWDDDDTVIQYHPAKTDYVNIHPNCLHLWRPTDAKIIKPPAFMVGPK